MLRADVDNTELCPLGEKCRECNGTHDLTVATFGGDKGMGVFCATVCRHCLKFGVNWHDIPVIVAFRAVAEHCEHLGIDLDEMADALKVS